MMLLVAIVTGAKAEPTTIFDAGDTFWSAKSKADLKNDVTNGNVTWYSTGSEKGEISTGNKTIGGIQWTARLKFGGGSTFKSGSDMNLVLAVNVAEAGTMKVYFLSGSSGKTRSVYVSAAPSSSNRDTATAIATASDSGSDGNVAEATIANAGTYYIWCAENIGVYGVTFEATGPAKDYTVTAASNNSNYGTVATSATSLDEGETATITATPKDGYEFTSWAVEGTGAELSSTTDNPTTLTMGTANATVTATFSVVALDVTLNEATNGSYTVSVAGGEATSANTTATIGQTITLAGTPAAASFTEVSWNVKDASDNEVTVTDGQFTMPGTAVTISPVFSKPYFVKVAVKNKNTATITGTASSDATADVSCQDNTKLGSNGHHVGFSLASETFQAGDIVEVKITEGASGTFTFYEDNEGTSAILTTTTVASAGTHRFALPATAEGKNSIYLYRHDSNFNPYVSYIAIVRPDATIPLNASGFATYSSAVDFEFVGADAYGMKLTETSLVGTKVTSGKIAAGEGILFKGEAGATVAIIEATGAEAIGDANNLIGTTNASEDIISSSYTYKYALSGDTFMTFTGTLQANKAFFGSDTEIAASLDLVFDDDATAINGVNANENVSASAPVKVIKNGKLYIGNYNVAGQQVK